MKERETRWSKITKLVKKKLKNKFKKIKKR